MRPTTSRERFQPAALVVGQLVPFYPLVYHPFAKPNPVLNMFFMNPSIAFPFHKLGQD